ncbi:GNAT family N-acetyltransferase [Streptomyces sp. NPDC101151]|uniref:GNAT family N-acetyltransferase n=1 Tax=Streptomyces sp. NPDC101151 TaxID=3366115 RepID=UPI00380ACD93
MAQHKTDLPVPVHLRPQEAADLPGVLELINEMRLPGEAVLRPAAYQHLTAQGRVTVHVGMDPLGRVLGAMGTSLRAGDGSGLIHWLYARQDAPHITAALLSQACTTLGPRRLYAFSEPGPSALAAVPGLPIGHRYRLADALMGARFIPCSSQRFLLLDDLTYLEQPVAARGGEPPTKVTALGRNRGWLLAKRQGKAVVASAVLLAPREGTALLWQLHVSSRHRRRGMGSRLLGQCLDLADANGAQRVAAYADRDDSALYHMLLAHHFCLVDTLVAYRRGP